VHGERLFGETLLGTVGGEPRVGRSDRVGEEVARRRQLIGRRRGEVADARLLQPERDRVAVCVVDPARR